MELPEELILKLNEYLANQIENAPFVQSDRYCVGDTDSIAARTTVTITFTVSKLWVVRLVKFYADAVVGLDYQWIINGRPYLMSEGEFYKGKTIHIDIKLIIANPTASLQEVAYRIIGWGDLVG